MFFKVLVIFAVVAVAMGIEYPKGLHPAVCPNYPYCDMEVLARHTPEGMPIPEWELPYARMVAPFNPYYLPYAARIAAPIPAKAEKPAAVVAVAPGYPADVDPASCPNYPYCA